ncbi:DUF4405 domain-containing protein [Candidatus Woesearchaeota archaeon]|nr:DUF4405 domain-containing protein [Candidatus Woesearchaeota archaeon]
MKAKTNYIIDIFLGISFIITTITGLIIFFFLPSGVQRSGYQEFLGIIKQTWSSWHEWAGIIMIVLALVHLILHWKWIVCMTKACFAKKNNKLKTPE